MAASKRVQTTKSARARRQRPQALARKLSAPPEWPPTGKLPTPKTEKEPTNG